MAIANADSAPPEPVTDPSVEVAGAIGTESSYEEVDADEIEDLRSAPGGELVDFEEARQAHKARGHTPRAAGPIDLRIGQTLAGRYRVERLIGKGGMGRVYVATQFPLQRSVAVKILSPEFQKKDPQFVRRFFLEAATAARLNHPNTITVFDYGETDSGELFIAMEYLKGRALSRVLGTEGPFPAARTLHVAMQIARALREAHSKGIIHRDLKPGNIMLLEEGDDADYAKVLDFGLVKLFVPEGSTGDKRVEQLTPLPLKGEETRAGMFLGSPKYMSPEQIQGMPLDPRTDIYSLGIITFQMLAGRVPFRGASSVDIIYKHVNHPVPAIHDINPEADAPPELAEMIMRCLAKNREQRYASMADLLVHMKEIRRAIIGAASISGASNSYDLVSLPPSTGSYAPAPLPELAPARISVPPVSEGLPRVSAPLVETELESSKGKGAIDLSHARSFRVSPIRRLLRGLPLVGAVLLVLSLGGAAFKLSSERTGRKAGGSRGIEGQPAQPGPTQPKGPLDTPQPVPDPSPIPALAEVRVRFNSDPEVARVYHEDRLLGTTPFEAILTRNPEGAERQTFVFKKKGYLDQTVIELLDTDSAKIHASLRDLLEPEEPESKAATTRKSKKPRARPDPNKRPAPPPEYKENPY